ncbi:MAG: methyltransferase [Candidatus Delongbacteria bacterium]|jgi:23S rRNA (guanine1835-N2)-methyltransferase|nr:methyltransferase [Candidatus Delongbacteria bacterium]
MNIQDNKYSIKRYDLSEDKSLQAWNAADEYLLQAMNDQEIKPNNLSIYNDRFGFLACHLNEFNPSVVITNKSQQKSIESNLKANDLPSVNFEYPIYDLDSKMDIALVKIPKSLDLFRLFLEHITQNSTDDVTVLCAFMTRYFSPNLLEIAKEYFEVIEQSRAQKKSRLLILNKKKKSIQREMITSLTYKDQEYRQYLGVFSAEHIDYATQFFLDHLEVKKTDQYILDLASGNGVIGNEIFKQLPDAEIHLMDDSFLAVESAKLNISGDNIHHHFNNELSIFDSDSFDLIVTNPPFHFEYEINIQVPLQLFRGCHRCLKKGGNLQIVANKHLNYKTHLERLFKTVQVIAEAKKFIVYKCVK